MFRKTLTILSLIGLLLSVGLWGVSGSGGGSFTHFYSGQDGEWIAFLCGDGRIGWYKKGFPLDTPGDMSSRASRGQFNGVSIWLPTVVLAGSFLFFIFQKFWSRTVRRVAMVLGRASGKLHKTLTILSLIGLLLSVGLLGVSYFNCGCVIDQKSEGFVAVTLSNGCFRSQHHTYPQRNVSARWSCSGFQGFWTNWSGRISFDQGIYGTGVSIHHIYAPRYGLLSSGILCIPLWLPTLLFGVLPAWLLLPFNRRRKRKKLGLCLKCGYDLRASKDRCPECGEEFAKRMRKACDMRRMTFALLMLVSVSCASPARQSYVGSGRPHVGYYFRESGGEWNGLKLGMTKDDARRLLGEPYQINTKEVSVVGEFWCYSPYGYVLFRNDKVSGWQVPNENLAILYRPS